MGSSSCLSENESDVTTLVAWELEGAPRAVVARGSVPLVINGSTKGARKNNRDLQTYLRWKPGGRDDFFYTRIFFTPHIFFTISIFCLAAAENIDR